MYKGMYWILNNQVGGELWVSGYPKLSVVKAFEIDAIVSVCRKGTNSDVIDFVDDYAHYTIPDGKIVRTDLFLSAAFTAAGFFESGQKTLIHCLAGRNRSMTVATLLAVKYLEYSGEEALEMIREIRPGAIANLNFERWLKSIESLSDCTVTSI